MVKETTSLLRSLATRARWIREGARKFLLVGESFIGAIDGGYEILEVARELLAFLVLQTGNGDDVVEDVLLKARAFRALQFRVRGTVESSPGARTCRIEKCSYDFRGEIAGFFLIHCSTSSNERLCAF